MSGVQQSLQRGHILSEGGPRGASPTPGGGRGQVRGQGYSQVSKLAGVWGVRGEKRGAQIGVCVFGGGWSPSQGSALVKAAVSLWSEARQRTH